MLVYWVMRLKYMLLELGLDLIPDINIVFPDYHDTFTEIVHGIGYFIDLHDISILFSIFIAYNVVRLGSAFFHRRK